MKKACFLMILFGIFCEQFRMRFSAKAIPTSKSNLDSKINENSNLFNPKMNYDEWTPLGRGDPLKNDPTYDYVPPVLERVHYWIEPSKRTPDLPLSNSNVLILGSRTEAVFTNRATTKRSQPFRSKESQADSRIDGSSLLNPFLKLMEVPQFGLSFNRNPPTAQRIHRPAHQNSRHNTPAPQALQRPPYAMLVPPPPPLSSPAPPSRRTTTDSTAGNLMTGFESLSPRPTAVADTQVLENAPTTVPMVFANTVNVFKPVAISMPEEMSIDLKNPQKEKITENSTKNSAPKNFFKYTSPATFNSHKQSQNETKLKQPQKPTSTSNHLQSESKQKPLKAASSINKTRINEEVPLTKRPVDSGPDESKPFRVWPGHPREDILRATTTSFFKTTIPLKTTATTTKINTLTTDPLFEHYNQPPSLIRGPLYLIIQGHSKVKTYGAKKNAINSLITNKEIKQDENEGGLEKKSKRLRFNFPGSILDNNHIEVSKKEKERSFNLMEKNDLKSKVEAFLHGKEENNKKEYQGHGYRSERSALGGQRLAGWPEAQGYNKTEELLPYEGQPEDLERLIAEGDDYDSEVVADILLDPQGSGYGSLRRISKVN